MRLLSSLFVLVALLAGYAGAAPSNGPWIWGSGSNAKLIARGVVVTSPTGLTGTVSNSASGTTVTGTSTKFLTELRIGDTITAGGETHTITAIASDTSLTTDAWTGANSGVIATRTAVDDVVIYPNGNFQMGGTRTTPLTNLVSSNVNGAFISQAAATGSTTSPTTSVYAISYTGANSGGSSFILMKTRGTEASFTVPSSGDTIGALRWRSMTAAGTTYDGAIISGLTTEAWSSTAAGSQLLFRTTPNTTKTLTTALTLDQDQSATFTGQVTVTGDTVFKGTNAATGVAKMRGLPTNVAITGATTGGTTDGGTATFALGTSPDGLAIVSNNSTRFNALVFVTNAGGTVTIVSDPHSNWSTGANTASKDCVTISSGTITIRHNSNTNSNNFRVTFLQSDGT
jgi:hypothetical protein